MESELNPLGGKPSELMRLAGGRDVNPISLEGSKLDWDGDGIGLILDLSGDPIGCCGAACEDTMGDDMFDDAVYSASVVLSTEYDSCAGNIADADNARNTGVNSLTEVIESSSSLLL